MNKYEKIHKFICVENFTLLKNVIWNKMRSVVPESIPNRVMTLRFLHMITVSEISYALLNFYIHNKDERKKLSKNEQKQLKEIMKNGLETSVIFIGMIHDLYKFNETPKAEHGRLAASFFENYCKRNGITVKGIVLDMYNAIKNHSDKSSSSDNLFLNIIIDADMLSKFSYENIEEKSSKLNISAFNEYRQIAEIVDKDYKNKTTAFKDFLIKQKNSLECDMMNYPEKYRRLYYDKI